MNCDCNHSPACTNGFSHSFLKNAAQGSMSRGIATIRLFDRIKIIHYGINMIIVVNPQLALSIQFCHFVMVLLLSGGGGGAL